VPTSAAFSVDTARALPGPDWLRARRAAAAEQFASAPWPSADEEIWRYSRVADLDLDTYAPAGASSPAAAVPDAAQAVLDLVPQRAGAVVVVDGHIVHVDIADRWAAKGLALGALADDTGGEDALGQAAADPPDVFAQLNDAFTASPVLVRVPAGLVVDDPVLVVNIAAASGLATFPRLVVTAGADSQADVLDIHRSGDRPANLVLPVTELIAEQAARLGFVAVQDLGLATWQIASQVSRVDTGASLVSATAALGAEYARQRTDCRLEGRGASGTLLAAYFGEGDQTLDFRTFQDHAAPDTTSDLLFKGAVGGRSRSVYTGLIRVRKNARGTNAFQTNRNLKLSDDAWAQSVPNLEIENNDVRCSHASAVGPIDEEQRFYLESRGVPPAVTERLVVMGFFDEVLERLPVGAAVPPLRGAIAGKLARQDVDE
jgi:Fe-S cluster assembly protein SufD